MFGFLFILFRSWVIIKNKKDLVYTHSYLQQKILNFAVVGACQIFQFFRQAVWLLRNNRISSKFRYRISYNLNSINKLYKNYPINANFNLTTPATLSDLLLSTVKISYLQYTLFTLMYFIFTFENKNLTSKDTKVYPSLLLPKDTKLVLAAN